MNVETNPVLMDTAEIPLEVLPAFVHLILLNIETLHILFVLVSRSVYIAVMLHCIYVYMHIIAVIHKAHAYS